MGLLVQIDIQNRPITNVTIERKEFDRIGEMIRYVLWFDTVSSPLFELYITDKNCESNLVTLQEFLDVHPV